LPAWAMEESEDIPLADLSEEEEEEDKKEPAATAAAMGATASTEVASNDAEQVGDATASDEAKPAASAREPPGSADEEKLTDAAPQPDASATDQELPAEAPGEATASPVDAKKGVDPEETPPESAAPAAESQGEDEDMPPAVSGLPADDTKAGDSEGVPPSVSPAPAEEKKADHSEERPPDANAPQQAQSKGEDEEMPPAAPTAQVDDKKGGDTEEKPADKSAAPVAESNSKDEEMPPAARAAPPVEDKPPAKAAAPVAKAPAVAAPKPKLSFRAIAAALSGDSAKAAAPTAALPAQMPGQEGLFFVDAAGEEAAQQAPPQADTEKSSPPAEMPKAGDSTAPEEAKATAEVATCTICGLPGHDSSACPFAHPEDIDLGDIEESDSDDELNDLYPLFSRYVQQHVGALTPKDKRGLTGGGRYFGNEKKQAACWACAKTGCDANTCPDRGCFFCTQKGHESRNCPQRALKCAHCGLRGHAPVSCATLASQRLKDFSHVRCIRCGGTGHPNCGPPPKAPHCIPVAASPMQTAHTQQMLRQIAAGRARAKAFNTAPWRRPAATDEPPTTKMRLSEAPVPELTVCD